MRHWMKITGTAVLAAALLAGCTAKPAPEAPAPEEKTEPAGTAEEGKPDITLEQVMEANRIENLLKNHGTVSMESRLYEAEGDEEPVTTIRSQYTMEGGFLRMFRAQTFLNAPGYYEEAYADANYSGAVYAMSESDGKCYMHIYPAEEYASRVMAADEPESGGGELEERTVTDTAWQDGAAVLTVKTSYRDEADSYAISCYFVNPETCELYAVNTYTYGTDDSSMGAEERLYTYDEADTPAASPFHAVITDSDYCELSIILDYMGENQTTYWYPVAHGTQVYFDTERSDYTLYTDADMTQPVEQYTPIDVSGGVSNLFVVFDS